MQGLEITGRLGEAILLLPFAMLAIVMLLATRQRRFMAGRGAGDKFSKPGGADRQQSVPKVEAARPLRRDASPGGPSPGETTELLRLSRAVAKAQAAESESELGAHYIALGHELVHAGRLEEAAGIFSKGIRLAARMGQQNAHAEARLALGDILRRTGDLTSACEHWQIARGLFRELDDKRALAGTEARMRENGCPTDWVLNDF